MRSSLRSMRINRGLWKDEAEAAPLAAEEEKKVELPCIRWSETRLLSCCATCCTSTHHPSIRARRVSTAAVSNATTDFHCGRRKNVPPGVKACR